MDLYPVLVSHNSSASEAWAMRLQQNNVGTFVDLVSGLEGHVGQSGSITHLVFDGENRMDFGDVAILNIHTHELVGVCPGDKFSGIWHVVHPSSPIPMPIPDADSEIKTNEVEIHDVIVNAIRGEFHDFEDRFETALATKQNVGENTVTDEVGTELRKWVLLWVERNMRDETVFDKMKAADMLSNFVTSGNYNKYWMVGQ